MQIVHHYYPKNCSVNNYSKNLFAGDDEMAVTFNSIDLNKQVEFVHCSFVKSEIRKDQKEISHGRHRCSFAKKKLEGLKE